MPMGKLWTVLGLLSVIACGACGSSGPPAVSFAGAVNDLTSDGTALYAAVGPTLVKVEPATGAQTVLASTALDVMSIHTDGDQVFFLTPSLIGLLAGGQVKTTMFGAFGIGASFAAKDGMLYVIVAQIANASAPFEPAEDIMLMPMASVGGDASAPQVTGIHEVKTTATSAAGVFLAGDYLFAITPDGSESMLAASLGISGLAVDETHAYFIADGTLSSIALATPDVPTSLAILDDVSKVHWLALAGGHLYWNGALGVETVPIGGGTPSVFAAGDDPRCLTSLGGRLYWIEKNELRSAPLL